MNIKEKQKILLSVKCNINPSVIIRGIDVKVQEKIIRESAWGGRIKTITHDYIAKNPVLAYKDNPELRSKLSASEEAFDLIDSLDRNELINILKGKTNATEQNITKE